MDKYYGMNRANVRLTDNSDYTFFARTKANEDAISKTRTAEEAAARTRAKEEVFARCEALFARTKAVDAVFDNSTEAGEIATTLSGDIATANVEGKATEKATIRENVFLRPLKSLASAVFGDNNAATTVGNLENTELSAISNTATNSGSVSEFENLVSIGENNTTENKINSKADLQAETKRDITVEKALGKLEHESIDNLKETFEGKGQENVDDETSCESAEEISVYRSLRKKGKWRRRLLIRFMIASSLFLGIVAISKIDTPICQTINDYIKEAIVYDLDTSNDKELGEIKAVSLIEELEEEKSNKSS